MDEDELERKGYASATESFLDPFAAGLVGLVGGVLAPHFLEHMVSVIIDGPVYPVPEPSDSLSEKDSYVFFHAGLGIGFLGTLAAYSYAAHEHPLYAAIPMASNFLFSGVGELRRMINK